MSYLSPLQYKGIILYTKLLANPTMASLFPLRHQLFINMKRFIFPQDTNYLLISACPQVFFIWDYPFTFIFGGTSKFLGVQRKWTAFSSCKVVHHAVFCKYYAELAKTFFFCLTLGQTGSGVLSDPWPLRLSHHFFVILYITCQILFFIQNWMQDYLYIVMIIKQLN